MCGIAGFCNSSIDRAVSIKKMTDRMVHRGPDAEGFWIDDNSGWTFGHRRLSILDLSENGSQPMLSASGRYVISYNGEIYNAKQVKETLSRDGCLISYRGSSDTEVLLEAIEFYGMEKAISLCKGMFAIAVYDREKRVLQLARDRAGEKPLYYGYIKGNGKTPYLAFASDIALFKELPEFENEIDHDALAEYMLHSYIPSPMSIYKGIRKLIPGCILTLKEPYDCPVIEEYWSMTKTARYGQANQFSGSEQEATEELERLLRNSISQQMIADVPLGAFLSGGIDSATIVSLMQDMSNSRIKTFTIGFDNPKYNEAEYAKQISEHLGTDHTEMIISESEMQEIIPDLGYYFSEPFGDSSMIPTLFVSKIAKEKVTVSLSGDAGDELFCGYEGYWKCNNFWDKMVKVPSSIRHIGAKVVNACDGVGNDTIHRIAGVLRAQNICQLKDVIFDRKNLAYENIVLCGKERGLTSTAKEIMDPLADMQLFDMLYYHPDDILVKVDRAGMAVSLENRVPMLDKDVIEFAWQIPSEYKFSGGISKKVLRNILYKYVPQDMMERPKQGFCIPLEKWLGEGKTREWARELINNNHLVRDGFLDRKIVHYCWDNLEKCNSFPKLVWNVLMAEQWYRGLGS